VAAAASRWKLTSLAYARLCQGIPDPVVGGTPGANQYGEWSSHTLGMRFLSRGLSCLASAMPLLLLVGLLTQTTPATATTRTHHSVSIPHGWRSYSFERARISVPSSWAVRHNDGNCPDRSAPGTLVLGPPKRPALCSSGMANANTVSLSVLPANDPLVTSCPKSKVNGLVVIVAPCGSSDPAGIVLYLIPALRVQAEGTGTSDEDVTGPGAGTIVGRVLHTIRPA